MDIKEFFCHLTNFTKNKINSKKRYLVAYIYDDKYELESNLDILKERVEKIIDLIKSQNLNSIEDYENNKIFLNTNIIKNNSSINYLLKKYTIKEIRNEHFIIIVLNFTKNIYIDIIIDKQTYELDRICFINYKTHYGTYWRLKK